MPAIDELTAFISRQPNSDAAYSIRALCYAVKGEIASAVADFEKALSINPKNALALTVRGFYKGTKKDFDGALADYEMALSIDPNEKLAIRQRDATYGFYPNPAVAPAVQKKLAALKKEVEVSNQNFESYKKLYEFFFTLKLHAERENYFASLAKANEKNVCAYYFAAKDFSYKERKEYYDKAINNYDYRNGAICSAEAAFRVGRGYTEAGSVNDAEALRYFDLALERYPNMPYVRDLKAKIRVPGAGNVSKEKQALISEQERKAEVDRLNLFYSNDIVARSAKFNQYAKERSNELDTTPESKARLLDLMKKEMTAIIETANKALSQIGGEISPSQKNYYLRIVETGKAKLAQISQPDYR